MELHDAPPRSCMEGESDDVAETAAPKLRRSAAEIEGWLTTYLALETATPPEQIDVTLPFDRFGLSSATAVFMIGALEEWLGTTLDPTLPYDFPTIEALSRHLASAE